MPPESQPTLAPQKLNLPVFNLKINGNINPGKNKDVGEEGE